LQAAWLGFCSLGLVLLVAYFSKDNTPCGNWLACATMAVLACCKICARDRLAVSFAKSAS
jgi:hypothetical protein